MNLQTIRTMIRQEAASRLMVGTVASVDARGTNMISVRMSGGRVHTRTYTCVDNLEIGDRVLMARLSALDRVAVIGRLAGLEGTLSKHGVLAPPGNLAVTGYAGFLVAEWDTYPGEDVCWQIQHNTTDSVDGAATTAIVTQGSYYLYPIVDDDTDTGAPTTHYFRVRAVRWLGANNVMYSGWSSWTSDASVTWDGRYRTETELASTNENEGASLIGIFDSAGNFSSTEVEGALAEAYAAAAGGNAPVGASYVVIDFDGDLTSERKATAGTAISLTDGGAGSTLTFAVIPSDIDHGALGGLGDDDHTIYLLADGSRNLAGNLGVDGGITIDGIDISAHAANNAAHHALITLDANAEALLSLSTQELGLDAQVANTVFAGPAAGGNAVPTFRSLATADLPVINHNDRPDLQGGQANEYYHLTNAQHTAVGTMVTAGLDALTQAEVDQLENIAATTISEAQWGYLGVMDQSVATGASPTFANVYVPDDGVVGVDGGPQIAYDSTAGLLRVTHHLQMNSGNILPAAATGQVLGTAPNYWDLYARVIHMRDAGEIMGVDNSATAFIIRDSGGADDYLTVVSLDAQRELVVNQDGVDIDFIVEATGHADALVIQGSDGQVTLGALGAGFVQSGAGGVLSVAATISVGQLTTIANPGYCIISGAPPSWITTLTPNWLGKHAFSAGLSVAAGQGITVADNNAAAFLIVDAGGADDYLTVVSLDAQRALVVNQDGVDIDFIVEATGHVDALVIQGNDGQVTLGALSSGFVLSSAAGTLSVTATISPAKLTPPPAAGYCIISDAVPAWTATLTPTWPSAHAFNAGLSVAAGQGITMGNAAWIGIAGNELLTVNAAGNFTFSGVTSVVVPDDCWIGATAACSWVYDSSGGYVSTSVDVGIGIAIPSVVFHVDGTVRFGGGAAAPYADMGIDANGLYVEQRGTGGANDVVRYQASKSGDLANYIQMFVDPSVGVTFMTIGTGQANVGILTAAPSRILDCNDGGGNMIADGYDNHPSWLANKVDPRPMSDVLTRFKQLTPYEYKRVPYVSAEELATASREMFGQERWEQAFPDGYRGGKLKDCPDPEIKAFLDSLGDQLRAGRRNLPEWQRLHYGLAMDDLVGTFPDILSRDAGGDATGYSLNNYVGLLHACITELLDRVELLEAR